MLNNKTILITGGTGTFGKMFLKKVLRKYKKIKRLVILSRDEFKQSELSETFPQKNILSLDIIWVTSEIK